MNTQQYYESLVKPEWAPDTSVFGQVWSVLYVLIAAVNLYVIYCIARKKSDWKTGLPFWINLAANLAYTPLQFGIRSTLLATIDILIVLATTVWAMIAIAPVSKLAATAFVPYLVWVGIATVLQMSILILN